MINAAAFLSVILTSPKAAAVDASCLEAPPHIATDNVPVGNGVPTSVVNIWGFVPIPTDGPAVAWLYKNGLGSYYVQFNYRAHPERFRNIAALATLIKAPRLGSYYPVISVSPSRLIEIENAFLAQGISRVGCFSHDYSLTK